MSFDSESDEDSDRDSGEGFGGNPLLAYMLFGRMPMGRRGWGAGKKVLELLLTVTAFTHS